MEEVMYYNQMYYENMKNKIEKEYIKNSEKDLKPILDDINLFDVSDDFNKSK